MKKFLVAATITLLLAFSANAHRHHHYHHHGGYIAPLAFGLGMITGRTFPPMPPPVVVVPSPQPVRVWVGGYCLLNGVYVPGHWEYR